MATIDLSRVPEFYHGYIGQVNENKLSEALERHQTELVSLLKTIPDEKWGFRYAENKWSIRELVQHIIDAERIFGYRALCFARKDKTALPGFDENSYAGASKAERRTKEALIEELNIVQRSSVQLFSSFDQEQLNETGIANGKPVYVEAIGFIMVGHCRHHGKVLREKYLQEKTTHG